MKSIYPSQIGFFWNLRGKYAKYPAPPAKMQKRNFTSKIPKEPPKLYEIHIPNSDGSFLESSGKCAKYPGPSLQKCKKAIS